MSNVIKDGSGTGNVAKVDGNNRLHVDSVQRTQSQQAILQGNGYSMSTGSINLTSDGESGLFYLKYDGEEILVIKEIIVILGDSTGGSGSGNIRIYKNPASGTLVSTQSVLTPVNRDFSSFNSLDGNIYKGFEGATVTSGDIFTVSSRDSFTEPVRFDVDIIVLRKGNSIAVSYQPPSSNTSQNAIVAVIAFEELADIE